MFFDLVPQVRVSMDHVMDAAPFFFPLHDACFLKLDDQAMRGAFGNADPLRDVTQPRLWIFSKAHEHVRVVAEKRPVVRLRCDKPFSTCGMGQQSMTHKTGNKYPDKNARIKMS